ncbi:MAG TPA: hypothetical protein VHU83_02545, partial [Bryobacteraceae bacterium]|nr:hypothetical protein [Bryobacteraceae bacterium]
MRLYGLLAAALGLVVAGDPVRGQSTTSVTDSRTPPEVAMGIPTSAYALTNIDTVDPYTGSVNIHIPLYKVGGRGEAGYTVMLLMESKWQTVTHSNPNANGNYYLYPEPGNADNSISYYLPTVVRYTPGVVFSRLSTDSSAGTFACTGAGTPGLDHTYYYGALLTRLTFIDETGTEHELVDTQTNGQPIALNPLPNCQTDPINGGTDRGRTFRSTDGTDLVFIADSDVHDQPAVGTKSELVPRMMAGWLLFPDGRKFRIDSGEVSSITDRNGNQTTLSGGTVTDPLGRTIRIAEGTSAGAPDTITYPGAGGTQRQITVNYALLQNALDFGQALETPAQLFPTLSQASSTTQYNPWVVASVMLPNQTQYKFQYNSYGEVVQMTLPTGGMIGYQYPATMANCSSSLTGCVIDSENSQGVPVGIVERRLLARYEYANGSTPTRQTNYSYAATGQSSGTLVTVTDQDASGNTLRQVQDYLVGDAWTPDVWGTVNDYYAGPFNGKEYETATVSGSGQVLRQEYQGWTARACAASNWPQTGGGAEPCWWSSGAPMNHDPQLCAKWTVLADGSPAPSAAELYQYDQNNNRTDSYEYDYGAGPAAGGVGCPAVSGGWTRHVHTAYTGGTYATFNTGTPVTSAWLPGLASDRQTLNGAGTKVAEQQYSYDQQSLVNEPGMSGYSASFTGLNVGRGNVTTSAAWWNANNSYPAHTYSYDIAGNVMTDKDANGHTTSYGYADSYSDGINRNTYAHVTTETNALGMAAKWQWDFGAGKAT